MSLRRVSLLSQRVRVRRRVHEKICKSGLGPRPGPGPGLSVAYENGGRHPKTGKKYYVQLSSFAEIGFVEFIHDPLLVQTTIVGLFARAARAWRRK